MILNEFLITMDQSPALNLVLYEWQNRNRLNRRLMWVADVKLQMFTNTKTISYDHLRACQRQCQRGQTYWGVYQSLINKRLKHTYACAHTNTNTNTEISSAWELMLTVAAHLSWWCDERQHTVQRLIENMVLHTHCSY